MWAHSDVSRQWDAGIQELSWDIPKLHSMWKENPSASRKTPDLENWRPGYWITEMRVQLPYHPELLNIARYVRDKAMVDAWTGKSVSERQLNKMQEMSAFVLSSSSSYSSVLFSVWEAIVLLCAVLPRLRVLPCCAAQGLPGCGTAVLRALPSDLQSWSKPSLQTITVWYSRSRDLCQPCSLLVWGKSFLTNKTKMRNWSQWPCVSLFLGSPWLREEITFTIGGR